MGGTSAGAAMAGAFAMGKHPDDIDRGTHDIFVTNRAMQRYTWPRYSLLDHRHYDTQLSRYFGGINIEDLWIPYFAVSTNLSSYELHRHDRGDLFDAIRASGSIPVLLPPVYTPRRRDAGRRLPARQRADPHHARAEERAERRRQLPHPGAGALRRRLRARCPRAPS